MRNLRQVLSQFQKDKSLRQATSRTTISYRNGVTDELFAKTQTIILTLSLRRQKASEVALTPSTLQP